MVFIILFHLILNMATSYNCDCMIFDLICSYDNKKDLFCYIVAFTSFQLILQF